MTSALTFGGADGVRGGETGVVGGEAVGEIVAAVGGNAAVQCGRNGAHTGGGEGRRALDFHRADDHMQADVAGETALVGGEGGGGGIISRINGRGAGQGRHGESGATVVAERQKLGIGVH